MTPSPLSDEERVVVRKLEEVILGLRQPLTVWFQYLVVHPDHQDDDFKDVAFVILMGCMRDMIDAHTKRFAAIRAEARNTDSSLIYGSVSAMEQACLMPLSVFSSMSDDEQCLVFMVRDRVVHGYLSGTTQEARHVKIVKNRRVEAKRLTKKQILEISGESRMVLRERIRPIRLRSMPQVTSYANRVFQLDEIRHSFGGLAKAFESGLMFLPENE